MKKLLLLLVLVACLAAQTAASTFTVSNYENVFTITRSSSTTAETVNYRTVGINAIPNVHYTPAINKLTFAVGETSKTVTVEEMDVTTIPAFCRFQGGANRRYCFELLDRGGFVRAKSYRYIYYGNGYRFTPLFLSRHITDLVYLNQNVSTGHACQVESAMPSSNYVDVFFEETGLVLDVYDEETYLTPYTVSTDMVHNSLNLDGSREYHSAIHNKLYATIYFDQIQITHESYQYIQILADNETTYDGKDPNGNVNTPSESLYKACFELRDGDAPLCSDKYQFFPHRYDYYNQAAGNQPTTHTEFPLSVSRFYAQKFRDNSLRAADAGALVLDPSVKTLTVRFDANGKDEDTWGFRYMHARLALCDDVAPTLVDMQVSTGPYAKGNPFAVTLVFSEIVNADNVVLHTNWGDLTCMQDYTHLTTAVTFTGTIDTNVSLGTQLSVIGYDGVIKDYVRNEFSGNLRRTFNATVAQNYNYKITYDLNGGAATGYNPTLYNYETNTFTLFNPVREGYKFIGWTGSNGNTPQTTVTITQGSHGDLNFVADWAPLYDITLLPTEHGTLASDKQTAAAGETVTLTLLPEEGYSTESVTVMNGESPVQLSTFANDICTFMMPAANVTVSAMFKASLAAGDLNGDGNVDVTDVSILINVVLGKEVTLAAGATTDLNNDGNIDVTDVSLLIDIILGKN